MRDSRADAFAVDRPRRGAATPQRGPLARWWRRRPINRALVLTHRWPALVLGLLLVIECTSGVVVMYGGQLFRATSAHLYRQTPTASPIAPEQAIDIVAQAHPRYGASWVAHDGGVLVVGDPDYTTLYFVDPGTGRINGADNTNSGFLGWNVNLHECAFSCEGLPWYQGWAAEPVWTNGPPFLTGITWASAILGVLGCLLILLVLSSVKIWWPGLRKLGRRFHVRRGKGRFARDFDLHNVVGAVALPFLLMWGVTGAAFEFPGVEQAWIAVTGGETSPAEDFSLTPDRARAADPAISFDAAVSAALAQVPGTATWVGRPTKDTPYWEVDIDSGYGSQRYRSIYNADTYVLIDPHDASHLKVLEDARGKPAANRFYDKYFEPAHFGWQVNAWWRLVWVAMGLAPLVLMVTGLSTWLYRRGVRRRRANAIAAKDPTIKPVDDLEHELEEGHAADLDPDVVHAVVGAAGHAAAAHAAAGHAAAGGGVDAVRAPVEPDASRT